MLVSTRKERSHWNESTISFIIFSLLYCEGSFGATEYLDRQFGLRTPLSIVPHWMLSFTDDMSFFQRWYNLMISLYDEAVRKFVYLPVQEQFARKYFAHLEPLPALDDLLHSVSVVLINTHRALSPPRPTMPGNVFILISTPDGRYNRIVWL